MTTKELLIDQYNACYDEENWFKPLIQSLEGLTSEQAVWKSDDSNHSILQLIHHLIFWNERYYLRFNELPLSPVKESKEDTTFEIDEKNWGLTLKKLEQVMTELRDSFKNADEKKLKSSPYEDRNDPWFSIFSNINIHNAYHLGQIVYIRKLQGSWRKK